MRWKQKFFSALTVKNLSLVLNLEFKISLNGGWGKRDCVVIKTLCKILLKNIHPELESDLLAKLSNQRTSF